MDHYPITETGDGDVRVDDTTEPAAIFPFEPPIAKNPIPNTIEPKISGKTIKIRKKLPKIRF